MRLLAAPVTRDSVSVSTSRCHAAPFTAATYHPTSAKGARQQRPALPRQRTSEDRARVAHAVPEDGAERDHLPSPEGDSREALPPSTQQEPSTPLQGEPPLLLGSAAVLARAADPYRSAGQRLQSLLAGCGDGEEELLSSMLREESAESKLLVALTAAGLISGGACLACWLCGLDPLGGASLSLGTLRAAAVGAAAAVPLVAIKALLWSDTARAQLPFLEEVQGRQMEEFQPLLHQLNAAQCLVILGSEVVPGLLCLLPAATGGIAKTVEAYCALTGIPAPPFLPPALALSVAALLAALAKASEAGITTEEFDTVKGALDNADRYYRVMGQGRDLGKKDSAASEAAFRAVAVTWMARKQVAARFSATVAALEVLFLGALWQHTGDLAAPLAAALASAAVDFSYIRRAMLPGPKGPSAS